jgi:hypothetical protein
VLFAQGFLLMGGFVALSNFLGFSLIRAPFQLAPSVVMRGTRLVVQSLCGLGLVGRGPL